MVWAKYSFLGAWMVRDCRKMPGWLKSQTFTNKHEKQTLGEILTQKQTHTYVYLYIYICIYIYICRLQRAIYVYVYIYRYGDILAGLEQSSAWKCPQVPDTHHGIILSRNEGPPTSDLTLASQVPKRMALNGSSILNSRSLGAEDQTKKRWCATGR